MQGRPVPRHERPGQSRVDGAQRRRRRQCLPGRAPRMPTPAGGEREREVGLEAERRCGPGPELGEVPVKKPRPIEIGDEPTCRCRAFGNGIGRGSTQVVRACPRNSRRCCASTVRIRSSRRAASSTWCSRWRSRARLRIVVVACSSANWRTGSRRRYRACPARSRSRASSDRASDARCSRRIDPDHGARRVAVEGPHEHGKCRQSLSVTPIEEVMAPRDDSPHGAVPWVTRSYLTREQLERIVQAFGKLRQRQGGGPRSCQLECKRKAIQLADNVASLVVVDVSKGSTARARAMNSSTPAASSSPPRRMTCSPGAVNGSRVVVRICRSGHRASRAVASSATPSTTCSQVSRTRSPWCRER